jgi:hypothetical protein
VPGDTLAGGQAAVTQSNLLALDDKIASVAGSITGNDLYERAIRLGVASGQPGALARGEGLHKYDASAWEVMAHGVKGTDSDADIRALFLIRD